MITMVLGGLWHGAAWTFVIWGAYQGLILVLYRRGGPGDATAGCRGRSRTVRGDSPRAS